MNSNKNEQVSNFIIAAHDYVKTVKHEIGKTDVKDIAKMHMLHSKIQGVYDFVQYVLTEKKS